MFTHPIIILCNGSFPAHSLPLNILDNAGTVICTDGSADTLLKFGRIPHVIIGDLDSTHISKTDFKGLWIETPDQNKTDLQKALDWCFINNVREVTILGAMGKREDHSLGNLHVLAEFSRKMNICFVTDYASIYSFKGMKKFSSMKGQQISIVAVEPVKTISSLGLKYPLNHEPFPPACNGISNEATGDNFSVEVTNTIWLFINHID